MSGLARPARFLVLLLAFAPACVFAEPLQAAVASNFRPVMERLADAFEARSGHSIVSSYGSSGKHYAQIVNGAPFDVFLAADSERPRRLEVEGHAIAGSRLTYAIGKLVLWSPDAGLIADAAVLEHGKFRFIAIANPATAPYGLAARQTLEALGVWDALQPRLAKAENVGQAYAFVRSGNADLGFVALSQLASDVASPTGSQWLVPAELHQPIAQQAVLLRDSSAGRSFLEFLAGDEARALIRSLGYDLP